MTFSKVLAIDVDETQLDPDSWRAIDTLSEKRVHLAKDSREIADDLADTDCMLVGFGMKVGKDIIDKSPKLKYIGMFGTGYGNIDIDYARVKKITVTNIPGYSRESVAELVFGMILVQIRELERARKRAIEGDYSDSGYFASEIKDKVFGVIGLGNNGSRVAEIATAFGADVRYWSRNKKNEFETKGIRYEDKGSLIFNSDFLSLHLAFNKETENFLNEERIMKIKKGAIVVNTSPMELVDINALENRLKTGNITFILDHSDEMKEEDIKRLSKYKNFIVYPRQGI